MIHKYIISSEKTMMKLGQTLANACVKASVRKCVIYLQGELGAGKTTLTRGFLRALGYDQAVKSPSYTIVEPYNINAIKIYHFDLYRLAHPEELAYIGARDYFSEEAICLIEWPENGKGFVPTADVICTLMINEKYPNKRLVTITSQSIIGDLLMQDLLRKKN